MDALLAERSAGPVEARVLTGLAKIGIALRSHAWAETEPHGLNPTQGQILVLLRARGPAGMRLSELSEGLGVSPPTTSDSVSALAAKGLVRKERSPDDGRALAVVLTEAGGRAAARIADWPDALLEAVGDLPESEQAVLLRALTRMIRSLQLRGRIPVARICATCRFFRPFVHADPHRPHHCAFVDAPFGDRHLRLDCADHEAAPPDEAERIFEAFAGGDPDPGHPGTPHPEPRRTKR